MKYGCFCTTIFKSKQSQGQFLCLIQVFLKVSQNIFYQTQAKPLATLQTPSSFSHSLGNLVTLFLP